MIDDEDYGAYDELLSDCCGAAPISNGDSDSTDVGICPACGDHCEFVTGEES